MSTTTYLNFTVRRADGHNMSESDIDSFCDFIDRLMESQCAYLEHPHVATCGKSAYGSCEYYGVFEESDMVPYAESHPDLQMELIEESSDGDKAIRCLYQGDVMEMTTEIRYFPDPVRIPWKYGE